MRRILLVILIFLSGAICAQNYNPINPSRDTWFEYNSMYGSRILPIRIDSVRIYGNDTSYFNYRIFDIDNLYGNCIDQKDTNFFIDKMIVQPNGNHLFFNRYNDTILLKPFSAINGSWVLFRYSNGNYIEATVSSIIQQTILGNPDSVKIITLQAKDTLGNPIVDLFNGNEIRIGKNNGITHFFNTIDFPFAATFFDLIGKSNPDEGITNLSAAKIYDWNIGDEFQYSGGYNALYSGVMHDYEQFIILNKTISANSDTIVYTKDHIYYSKTYQFGPSTIDSTMYYIHDTVTQIIIVSVLAPLDHYSYEFIDSLNYYGSGYLFQFTDNQYFGRMKKTLDPDYDYSPIDSCVSYVMGWCIYPVYTYAKGIGLVSNVDNGTTCYKNYLVYYQKGTEIWGTPLDWLAITNVNSDSQKKSAVDIFPNPSSGIFSISSSEKIVGMEITDVLGEKVREFKFNPANKEIDLSGQSKGIYFVKILDEKGNRSVKKIILE